MLYFASLLVRYENAVASHLLEFAAQNAMRYRLSATLNALMVHAHTVVSILLPTLKIEQEH